MNMGRSVPNEKELPELLLNNLDAKRGTRLPSAA